MSDIASFKFERIAGIFDSDVESIFKEAHECTRGGVRICGYNIVCKIIDEGVYVSALSVR